METNIYPENDPASLKPEFASMPDLRAQVPDLIPYLAPGEKVIEVVHYEDVNKPASRGLPSSLAFQDVFGELLTSAVERGELSQEAEVKLRSQMLFDTYLSNFPQAIFEGWSLDALQARARDQIRILLAGARRG